MPLGLCVSITFGERDLETVRSGNGRGFLLSSEDFGRMLDHSFPACAFILFYFFEVEVSSRTLIPLFMPGLVNCGSVG